MQLINGLVGFLALVVLGLVLFRGVTRWRDLLVTISDAIIKIGVEIETLASRRWRRETLHLSYWERFDHRRSRLLAILDTIADATFSLAWRIEALGMGENHYSPNFGFGMSAASNIVYDEDDLFDVDDDEFYDDTRSVDDYDYGY